MIKQWFVAFIVLQNVSKVLGNKPSTNSTKVELRIVGGSEVKPNTLPWQVMLRFESGNRCGGTILCPKFVMSAGHCKRSISIEVGLHDITEDEVGKKTVHKVKTIHLHPKYERVYPVKTDRYDFCLFEVEEPIEFRPEARPLYLPKSGDDSFDSGTTFVVSGFGRLWDEDTFKSLPIKLNSVSVPWISDKDCKKAYSKPKGGHLFKIETPLMMCAGDVARGKIDSCAGDSGGTTTFEAKFLLKFINSTY